MNPLLTGSPTVVFLALESGNRYAVRGRVVRVTYQWRHSLMGSTTMAMVFDTHERALWYASGHGVEPR
jgi:hypothetical protein